MFSSINDHGQWCNQTIIFGSYTFEKEFILKGVQRGKWEKKLS
jgi:hypothetical protein